MNAALEALIESRIAELNDQITGITGHIHSMQESLDQATTEQNARFTQRDVWVAERSELSALIAPEDEDDDTE